MVLLVLEFSFRSEWELCILHVLCHCFQFVLTSCLIISFVMRRLIKLVTFNDLKLNLSNKSEQSWSLMVLFTYALCICIVYCITLLLCCQRQQNACVQHVIQSCWKCRFALHCKYLGYFFTVCLSCCWPVYIVILWILSVVFGVISVRVCPLWSQTLFFH